MIRIVLFIIASAAVSCHVQNNSEIRVTAVRRGVFSEERTEQ